MTLGCDLPNHPAALAPTHADQHAAMMLGASRMYLLATEAHRVGLDVDTAAAAVGMSPSTARMYYLAMDQEKAAVTLSEKLADTLRPTKKKPKK